MVEVGIRCDMMCCGKGREKGWCNGDILYERNGDGGVNFWVGDGWGEGEEKDEYGLFESFVCGLLLRVVIVGIKFCRCVYEYIYSNGNYWFIIYEVKLLLLLML